MRFKNEDKCSLVILDNANDYLALDDECSYRTEDMPKKKISVAAVIGITMFCMIFAAGTAMAAYGEQIFGWLEDNYNGELPDFGRYIIIGFAVVVFGTVNLLCILNLVQYVRLSIKMKRCTEEVEATAIMVKIRRESSGKGHSRRVFYPVYSYYYGGRYYIAESDDEDFSLRMTRDPHAVLGQKRNVTIDPDEPYTLNTNKLNSGIATAKLISYILPVAIILPVTIYVVGLMSKTL